jgi:competence protein ComEA
MRRDGTRNWVAILALTAALVAAAPIPVGAAPPPEQGSGATAARININTAGVDELMSLPGIGKAYAERILEYRQKNGPFKKPEDLLNVRGVGEKTYERIKERITVGRS